jgi:acetyl esterase/lipase
MKLTLLLAICQTALLTGCSAISNFMSVDGARSLFERGYLSQFLRVGKREILVDLPANYRWIKDERYGLDALQSLDIFAPTDQPTSTLRPVVLFVHGGGWRAADKQDSTHVHRNLCVRIAALGVVVINVNHRLSPAVQHPTHVQDVALALKWVKANISRYQGDINKIYLSGHSSGAHLVTLLATDNTWAKQAGTDLSGVQGIIGISGVYDLQVAHQESWFFRTFMGKPAFGDDPAQLAAASPVSFPSSSVRKFLLIAAEHDEGSFAAVAQRYALQLQQNKISAETLLIHSTDHFSVLLAPSEGKDELLERIRQFIE